MIRPVKSFGILLSQGIDICPFHIHEEAAADHAGSVLRCGVVRCDGIDSTTPVQFTGDNGVPSGAVVDIDSAGYDSLCHPGAGEESAGVDALEEALWALPVVERQALYLTAMVGLPAERAAAALGLSRREEVYAAVRRGRGRLRGRRDLRPRRRRGE